MLLAVVLFIPRASADAPILPPLETPTAIAAFRTSAKEIWMNALADCESMGSTTIKVWDTNNQWSIGKYQYQYRTWAKYSEKFGTTKENITNGGLQDKVTRYILDNFGDGDWVNCSRLVRHSLGRYPL